MEAAPPWKKQKGNSTRKDDVLQVLSGPKGSCLFDDDHLPEELQDLLTVGIDFPDLGMFKIEVEYLCLALPI